MVVRLTNRRLTTLNRRFPTGSQHNAESTPRRKARTSLYGRSFQTSGLSPARAAVLKHGRYSTIAREVEARVAELRESIRALGATTRDRFMRRVYAGASERPVDPKTYEAVLRWVLAERLAG